MKRACERLLVEYLDLFPMVAVHGVRQCGKTTLLRTLGPDWHIIDLERGSDFDVASADPDLLLRLNPDHLAIDEAQVLPSLFPALRVAVDDDRVRRGRYVITGSSSPTLSGAISETLAGRIATIELSPLMWAEVSPGQNRLIERIADNRRDQRSLIDGLEPSGAILDVFDYWFRGGYPEPWIRNDTRFTQIWMEQYMATYIDRDIRRLFPGLNHGAYRTFVQMLAGVSGQILNLSDIARSLGVSQPTARSYLEIAHGSFIWRTIPAFTRDVTKRVVRHPKGYLRDTGLLHHFLRIPDTDALLRHPVVGRSWEGMVVEEILRRFHALGVAVDPYYYRTSAGAEVDLICEGVFGTVPFEIKRGERVDPRDLRGLRDFVDQFDLPFGIVVNADRRPRRYDERIVGVPFTYL